MKKKVLALQIGYYLLTPIIFGIIMLIFSYIERNSNMSMLYGSLFVFCIVPIEILIAVRFSPLRWYIDPFIPALFLLSYYCVAVLEVWETEGVSLVHAIHLANHSLCNGALRLYFIGLFVIGIIFSFSVARKNGKSVFYKICNKLLKTGI